MSLLRKVFRRFVKPARGGFVRDERGTTAIEFAILGVPFFALLGATLETAYVFLGAQILDTAVQDASRYVRTGQLQNGNFGNPGEKNKFRQKICDELYGLFDCTKLWVGVETVSSFTAAAPVSPLPTTCTPTNCDWSLSEVYSSGGNSSVMMVRVYYKWPTLLNLGGFNLANTGANSRLLASVRVFKNEPF